MEAKTHDKNREELVFMVHELLEALENCADALEYICAGSEINPPKRLDDARAAIAKAKS